MILWASLLTLAGAAQSARSPLHDPIPKEFLGTFAATPQDCNGDHGVDIVTISPNGVHYYEGNDYLLIGVGFSGGSTKSGKTIPLFNGRFTGRMETQLLGEVNARMEMEEPNLLIRYVLKDDGEPDPAPVNIWVRCPSVAAK